LVHPSRKVPVSLRIDEDVLAWFKDQGARYQTRMNAVLRAYVDRHVAPDQTAREAPASYRSALLADLEAARERYEALATLRRLIGSRILDVAEKRIRAHSEQREALRLPVLFFYLVRRQPPELRRFDALLGHLLRTNRKGELPGLVDSLRSETDYRQAASALFEIEVLSTLLDATPSASVTLHPRIDGTKSRADAAVRLARTMVYVEVKLVSQDARQERIQDIGIASAHGQRGPSKAEMSSLGLASVDGGVTSGWGTPYDDALRVLGKLTEKPGQLHPGAPNVVCLGLCDPFPDKMSSAWAIEALFSGSRRIAEIAAEQERDAVKAEALKRLARDAKPEPRLTGVLVFRVSSDRTLPLRAHLNPHPGAAHRLPEREWTALLEQFGFPV
jgi:hypothetical protein